MIDDLLDRPTPKRPSTLTFDGRILYLADDARLVREQLYEDRDLELDDDLRRKLRDQISTDEITPAYICYFYDETLGEFPYLGLRATERESGEDAFPVLAETLSYGVFYPVWVWLATVETHRLVQAVIDGRAAVEAESRDTHD